MLKIMNRLIIIIIIALIGVTAFSQKLEINKGKYFHGSSPIEKMEFEQLLKNDADAYSYYTKSQSQYKQAKWLGLSSIACLPIGLFLVVDSLGSDQNGSAYWFCRHWSKSPSESK